MIKKVNKFVLSALLIGSILTMYDVVEAASVEQNNIDITYEETDEYVSGDYTYSLNSDGTITITSYAGNESELIIPSELDSYKVVAIGEKVFYKNSVLESVVIPDTVTSIGVQAFSDCSNLSKVTLSKNQENLDCKAFAYCDKITEIYIPKSILSSGGNYAIASGPFYECNNLEAVIFEDGIDKIAPYLFHGCKGLTEVTIPETVSTIGDYSFSKCSNLTVINLSSRLENIGIEAFSNTAITNLVIPDSVHTIQALAFQKCTSLEQLKLSNNLNNLDYGAFDDCTKLTYVKIPKSLESAGQNYLTNVHMRGPFSDCSSLSNIEFEEGTTRIIPLLFNACTGLKEFILPDEITSVGAYSFAECSNLATITFTDNLTQINSNAFEDCVKLNNVTIPESVATIKEYTFSGCTSLTDIELPDNLKILPVGTFKDCTMLADIEFPDAITEIEGKAFENNDALVSIRIPDSVTFLGAYCFDDCDNLTDVRLSANLKKINEYTFSSCDSLQELVIPYRVTEVGKNAFSECVKLENITIPRSVSKMANSIFTYPENMTIYGIEGTYAQLYANAKEIKFVHKEVNATEAIFDKKVLELNKGESERLILTIEPYNFTDIVSWQSSDTTVVTVNEDGKIEAVGSGNAVVEAIVGSVKATCNVTVASLNTSVDEFVERMYTVALNRPSDETGKANWVAMLNSGAMDGAAIAGQFILGEEFKLRGLNDEEYVDVLYRTFFNREADAGGKSVWISVLSSGQTRAFVLSNFVNLSEFTMLCDSFGIERGVMLENGVAVNPGIPQFVKRMYTIVLGRNAENEGLYNNVMALVVGALDAEQIAKNFFTSQEYLMKNKDTVSYVKDLYAVFMNREADEGGLNQWVALIEQFGMTRDDVLSEFAASDEFKMIAAGYGLK